MFAFKVRAHVNTLEFVCVCMHTLKSCIWDNCYMLIYGMLFSVRILHIILYPNMNFTFGVSHYIVFCDYNPQTIPDTGVYMTKMSCFWGIVTDSRPHKTDSKVLPPLEWENSPSFARACTLPHRRSVGVLGSREGVHAQAMADAPQVELFMRSVQSISLDTQSFSCDW